MKRVLLLVGVLLALVVVGMGVRSLETRPAPKPTAPKVIAGTEAANHAPVEGAPSPVELGLPKLDTAAEATQDTCTMLKLSREKLRINTDMLGRAEAGTVEAARMQAMVTRQEKAIRRLEARAAKRGEDCPAR